MRRNIPFQYLFTVLFALVITSTTLTAQTTYTDSLALSASDSLQTYYRLSTAQQTSFPLDSWDIAFETQGITFGIWLNEAKGNRLYVFPHGDTSNWNTTIDTTGIAGWEVLHNSDTTWATGGFDRNSVDPYDVGWGWYTGPPNHAVNGDSINIIVMADGTVKKFWIISLDDRVYKFRYANLNGSNEIVDSVYKDDYAIRNFAYYNLATAQKLTREPNNEHWDLLFTKSLNAENPSAWKSIYLNHKVTVAKARGASVVNDFDPYSYTITDSTITAIGLSYLDSTANGWAPEPSTAYYVKGRDNEIYKLVFSRADSLTGVVTFNVTYAESTTGITEAPDALQVSMFPNPVQSELNVAFDLKKAGSVHMIITDIAGKVIIQQELDGNAGINAYRISTATLPQGVLLLNLVSSEGSATGKIIKSN